MTNQLEQDLDSRLASAAEIVYRADQPTPVCTLALPSGDSISLKREDLSLVRSYKWRGAFHKMMRCVEAGNPGPFAATSAGNHAQGVALAARQLDVNATIFMPQTVPELKKRSVELIGGPHVSTRLVGDSYDDAANAAAAWVETNHATVIPPFDDLDIIAGQATVARELLADLPRLEDVFVPIGGGGLAAGIAFAARDLPIRVFGVEAVGQDAMAKSIQAGHRVRLDGVDRFCDGTGVRQPGQLTFEICQAHLDQVLTVTNEQVCRAIEICWDELRVIPEPSGGLAVAGCLRALEEGLLKPKAETTAAIVTGANSDFLNLPAIVNGSRRAGNSRRFLRFEIEEHNGALIDLLENHLSAFNIIDFQYGKTCHKTALPVLGLSGAPSAFDALQESLQGSRITAKEVTQRETVIFRVIPFQPEQIAHPVFLHIDFPERRGALRDLMRKVSTYAGICYFNYAEGGTQEGQALIGFECPDRQRLFDALAELSFPHHEIDMGKLLPL